MIIEINKNPLFLSGASSPATKEDIGIAVDLLDTLNAHSHHCLGMAANMIGQRKNIIAILVNNVPVVLFNPCITAKKGPYSIKESCLSLEGERETVRYKEIELCYEDLSFTKRKKTFTGLQAQVLQHEIDHLSGILI